MAGLHPLKCHLVEVESGVPLQASTHTRTGKLCVVEVSVMPQVILSVKCCLCLCTTQGGVGMCDWACKGDDEIIVFLSYVMVKVDNQGSCDIKAQSAPLQ